jgi:hypothetical protein
MGPMVIRGVPCSGLPECGPLTALPRRVEITRVNGRTRVVVDGHDLSALCNGVRIDLSIGEFPSVVIHLVSDQVSIDLDHVGIDQKTNAKPGESPKRNTGAVQDHVAQ